MNVSSNGSKDLARPGPWKSRKRTIQRFPVGSTDGAGCTVEQRFEGASISGFEDLSSRSIHFGNYPWAHLHDSLLSNSISEYRQVASFEFL